MMSFSQVLPQKIALRGMMMMAVMLVSIAPAAAQSSLELFQNRVSALEEGLKDVRGLIEEDFRDLKQALAEQGTADPDSIRDIERKIVKIGDQLNGLNNRIERTLEVASDNEFRLLRMEKRIDSLMRLGIDDGIQSDADTDSSTGPSANTGAGAVASSSINANQNNDGNWSISTKTLDEEISKLPNPNDVATITPPTDTPPIDTASAETTTPTRDVLPEASPDDQFQFALGKALQNDLTAAEAAFDEFVALNPSHDRTNDATFWLGRVQFMKGSYEQAAMTFTEFNTVWPTDSRREKTTLWIAESISFFAPSNEVCDLLTSLPNLIEDPTENFFVSLNELKQKSACTG